ncbi:stress response translation initiation inhibitor YciH [Candidatus Pacearchaeota archaeon]|nr:stress response translation initiation inhibitor YciH [Candidatus Pacearchaeota archaeon]
MNICPKCGLPIDACICNELSKNSQKVRIDRIKRKFGKIVTVISGITDNNKDIAKKLKEELACGGTVKNNIIELQGDHLKKAKEVLVKNGFNLENIEGD